MSRAVEFSVQISWRDAVLGSIYRVVEDDRLFTRTALVGRELDKIIGATQSSGVTPEQTLSRVLQHLRDEGVVEFLGDGSYKLVVSRLIATTNVDVEQLELTDDLLDQAIRTDHLHMGIIKTDSVLGIARRRRGQARLRKLTLENYAHGCALCDVTDDRLLVASHILGWAEGPKARGRLDNVICLCRFHDSLFETGYWSLTNSFELLRRPSISSSTIQQLLDGDNCFRPPQTRPPASTYLEQHRARHGF